MAELKTTQGKTITISEEDLSWLEKCSLYERSTPSDAVRIIVFREGKQEYLATTILKMMGVTLDKSMCASHINGDFTDFRRKNLEPAKRARAIASALIVRAKYKFKGVSRTKNGKFRSRLMKDGKLIEHSGFVSAEDAALDYDLMALRYHGEDVPLNFPDKKDDLIKTLRANRVGKGRIEDDAGTNSIHNRKKAFHQRRAR